jgi:glycosyltransferase involved in cell wall biosynthesis
MASGFTVSVIVATRNRPETLRRSLEAIARQTHPAVEVVLVDDGSEPANAASNESLLRATLPRVTYLYLEARHGSGPSFARNRGLGLATGELVTFCDDDDFWIDPGHLAAAVSAFEADPELDLIFANEEDHVDGQPIMTIRLPRLAARLGLTLPPSGKTVALSKSDCLLGYFPHLNTCVYRRPVIDAIGGFWEGVRYAEDCDFFVRSIDAVRHVRYRDQTVAVHTVPDQSRQDNASTRLLEEARQLTCAYISQHLIQGARDPAVIRFARDLGGNAYRKLALTEHAAGQRARAAEFARLGLAAMYSPKWMLFTVYLILRRLVA